MRRYLIILFTFLSVFGYGQISVNNIGVDTTQSINSVNSGTITSINGILFPYPFTDIYAYWKLEDLTDSYGSKDLTNSGATSGQTGKILNCYLWDGVNDLMYQGTAADWKWMHLADAKWTFSFWTKFTAIPTEELDIFFDNIGSSGNPGIIIYYQNFVTGGINLQQLTCVVRNSSGDICRAQLNYTYPNDTDWHMVTITYDHTQTTNSLNIYVDGSLSHSGTKTANTPSTSNPGSALYIGNRIGNLFPFNGKLDEIGIYDIALTPYTIKQLYNNGNGRTY